MNLYLFNDNDSAAIYGIGTYLNELSYALKDSGVNIHIVNLRSVSRKFEIIKVNQIEYWNIPEVGNYNLSIESTENYFRNVVYILRIHIKDTKNLIFHFNYNHSQIMAKELKKIFDCKTVAIIHLIKWQLDHYGNLKKLYLLKSKPEKQKTSSEKNMLFNYEYENILFTEVDRLVALSEHTKKILEIEHKIDPRKIVFIPNGLDNNYFS